MSEDEINWQQMVRYLSGDCSSEERQRLEAWFRTDAPHRALMRRLHRIWEATEGRPRGSERVDAKADWEALDRALHLRKERTDRRDRTAASRQGPARHRRRTWLAGPVSRIAVLLVVLVGGALLAMELTDGPVSARSYLREVVTGRGERATLRLADGTKVVLNVDSRLRVSTTFEDRPVREVYLRGEAYFDVTPNPEQPFIVHAAEGVVEVKGTAFGVEAYPGGPEVKVTVEEGAVWLRSEQAERQRGTRVEAGQRARLTGADTPVTAKPADVEAYLAWTEGRLVFKNTPLPEVAIRLERWYDVECEIRGEALASLHLTATFNSRSIRNVLDLISAALALDYRIEDHTVLLTRKEE